AADFKGSPAINAAIISVAQKLEHYEIASYGCLREWASLLGNKEAGDILQQILVEEKSTNHLLSELARFKSNDEAEYLCASGNPCGQQKNGKSTAHARDRGLGATIVAGSQ